MQVKEEWQNLLCECTCNFAQTVSACISLHCSNQHSERRSSNHSLQMSSLNGLQDCTFALSSVSDYKHHMLSSSTNGVPPLYDTLCDYRKESVCSNYDKRTGSVSSDGVVEHTDGVNRSNNPPVQKVSRTEPAFQGVTVDMYASDGRILDSVLVRSPVGDNGASARDTTSGRQLFSSTGKIQSAHSLLPPPHQRLVQHHHSLRQLPTIQQHGSQHMLCPPTMRSMTGSSPAVSMQCITLH